MPSARWRSPDSQLEARAGRDCVGAVSPTEPGGAFRGTATSYLRHRPPYPAALIEDLVRRAGANGRGRLLDLGCGPGRLTFALAPYFREVLAVDAEPEMIAFARTEAARRGVGNVRWSVRRAEDVAAEPGSVDLVTAGESFHRFDQAAVMRNVIAWLRPGGAVATIGCSYGLLSPMDAWQRSVDAVVRRFADRAPAPAGMGAGHDEMVFHELGLEEVASHPFRVPVDWTPDSVVGFLFTTSICSRARLGEAADAFGREVRAALRSAGAAGVFHEELRFGYTFGRKPGPAPVGG